MRLSLGRVSISKIHRISIELQIRYKIDVMTAKKKKKKKEQTVILKKKCYIVRIRDIEKEEKHSR